MTIGWTIFLAGIIDSSMQGGIKNDRGIVAIANAIHIFFCRPAFVIAIVLAAISIVQNIIVRRTGKTFRCFIYYGIPAILFVLTELLYAPVSPISGKVYAKSVEYTEKKGQKNMAKWYTPEADIIVGQEYVSVYTVDEKGKITPQNITIFGKNGFAFETDLYTVDTATRTITVGKRKDKTEYRYFPDGSAYYKYYEFMGNDLGIPKVGAKFNADIATEVIGKSFSGKWNDNYTATITFGKNGRATVKFSDGDVASGSYIASDEDNMVLYNHKDAGVWSTLSYNDDYSKVRFRPWRAVKENGKYDNFASSFSYKWEKK